MVADVGPDLINEHLLGLAPSYRNALLRELRAVFSFAVKREWCRDNPVLKLDFETHSVAEREIYSVKECCALLQTAREKHPELLPGVAIGLFAGIRVYEMLRLEWRNIDFEENMIDLPAAITKRRRRRSIPIEATLKSWIGETRPSEKVDDCKVLPFAGYGGWRTAIRKLASDANVEWKQNALRHSYASYWLAVHNDLTKLALQMGHIGGLEVLHRFYHRSVRAKEATLFWALKPVSGATKLEK